MGDDETAREIAEYRRGFAEGIAAALHFGELPALTKEDLVAAMRGMLRYAEATEDCTKELPKALATKGHQIVDNRCAWCGLANARASTEGDRG